MQIRFEFAYTLPREKIWRALTAPALVERWFMRPEGMEPKVGTQFRLVDKVQPPKHWRGFVDCRVLECEEGKRFSHTWVGDEKQADAPQVVTYELSDAPGGCRMIFTHDGFRGVGGFVLSRFILGPGWKKHLSTSMPEAAAAA